MYCVILLCQKLFFFCISRGTPEMHCIIICVIGSQLMIAQSLQCTVLLFIALNFVDVCDRNISSKVYSFSKVEVTVDVHLVFWSVIDVDECSEQLDTCQQDCINTIGSYRCSCKTGYRRVSLSKCAGNTIIWSVVTFCSRVDRLPQCTFVFMSC